MKKDPRAVVPVMMALFILAVTMASAPVLANVDAEVEAELKGSGDLIVTGTTKVDSGEAKLTRTAIDSKVNIPTIGFLGTGNGDGVVNTSEVEAYVDKALETGLVNKAFETGIVRVTEDSKPVPVTLDSFEMKGAEGNISSLSAINVTFTATFQLEFDKNTDSHIVAMSLSFVNVSYDLSLTVPRGWNIENVHGLKKMVIVNNNERSEVKGEGQGDGTLVTVEVKKEGDVCGLFLIIGMIILVIIIIMVYRNKKKRRLEQQAMTRPEYVRVGPDGEIIKGDEASSSGPATPVKRLEPEKRTFGKDYFSEDEKKK